jgi:hypothetical protein
MSGSPHPTQPAPHFRRMDSEIAVAPILAELADHPELWDAQPLRTTFPGTPFGETSDIWVRYGKDPETWSGPHFAEFWPAWDALPSLHPIVFDIMHAVNATTLGGILITKVPAGKRVEPHNDRGHWHPDFYLCKAYVIIQSNDQCVNMFEDESVVMRAGEAWLFDNRVLHGVENHGDTDRIALVQCMRVE